MKFILRPQGGDVNAAEIKEVRMDTTMRWLAGARLTEFGLPVIAGGADDPAGGADAAATDGNAPAETGAGGGAPSPEDSSALGTEQTETQTEQTADGRRDAGPQDSPESLKARLQEQTQQLNLYKDLVERFGKGAQAPPSPAEDLSQLEPEERERRYLYQMTAANSDMIQRLTFLQGEPKAKDHLSKIDEVRRAMAGKGLVLGYEEAYEIVLGRSLRKGGLDAALQKARKDGQTQAAKPSSTPRHHSTQATPRAGARKPWDQMSVEEMEREMETSNVVF